MKTNEIKETGFYWAKVYESTDFNAIVEVHGKAPFFHIHGVMRFNGSVKEFMDYDISEWGPKIQNPE